MTEQVADRTLKDSDFRLISYLRQYYQKGCTVDIPKTKVLDDLGWTLKKLESTLRRIQSRQVGFRID